MKLRVALGMFAFVLVVATAGFRSSLAQAPAQPPSPLPAASLECPDLAAALRTVANNDARLRDWPQIVRYREANRAVTSSDVVFMGDSITDAWPQPRFGAFFPGKNYVGRGISGQTTPQMLIRMRRTSSRSSPRLSSFLAAPTTSPATPVR